MGCKRWTCPHCGRRFNDDRQPTTDDETASSDIDVVNKRIVGARLRELRGVRKLTSEQLASMTGLSRNYIERLERGEMSPTVKNLVRLATALRVDAGDVIRNLASRRDDAATE